MRAVDVQAPPHGLSLVPSSADVTSEILLARVAGGDRDAFAQLYDRLGPTVYGLVRRVVVDEAIAQDVTQDVLLEVWSKARSFDAARGSARSWISTMAHRRAVDVVRREQASRNRTQRVAAASLEQPFDEVAETVIEADVARSNVAEVARALAVLTPVQRCAIELAYFKGMTYREVAQRLDVPLGTAKTRIRDGLRRLGDHLGTGADDPRPLHLS